MSYNTKRHKKHDKLKWNKRVRNAFINIKSKHDISDEDLVKLTRALLDIGPKEGKRIVNDVMYNTYSNIPMKGFNND